jgi:DNA-binding NarL/FixJ family response regulator
MRAAVTDRNVPMRQLGRRRWAGAHGPGIVEAMESAAQAPTRIYLVEDSLAIRARLSEMIGHLPSVRVVGEAATPRAAIDGIAASHPDVVVLDLHLREGSGLDVLRAAHQDRPGIVFVVLTNHPTDEYRKLCVACGAQHFLDKSNEFTRINEIIAALPRAAVGATP